MIGRYKLLEKVGEGGCGVVYVAEQTESVRRRVALKVIKLARDRIDVVLDWARKAHGLAIKAYGADSLQTLLAPLGER